MELLAFSHHWVAYDTAQAEAAACSSHRFAQTRRFGLGILQASGIGLAAVLWLMATVAQAITAYVDQPGGQANILDQPVDGGIVRVATDGDRLEITTVTQDGWTQLADGNWIATNAIRLGNQPPSGAEPGGGDSPPDTADPGNDNTPSPTDNWGTSATIAVNRLNAHWGPGEQYGIYRTLAAGNQISLTGQISPTGWMQLIDGTWVLGNQLNPRYGGYDYQGQPPTNDWGTSATVNASRINVRWGPGVQYGLYRTLGNGSVVQLTGSVTNGWVQLIDGTWVAGSFLNPPYGGYAAEDNTRGINAVIDTPAYSSARGYNLNVRAGPGVGTRILQVLADGQPITLTGNRRNQWYELTNGSWVWGNFVRVTASSGNQATVIPAAADGTLRRGVQDPAVAQLQRRLRDLGYFSQNATITNYYGDLTERAVIDFQRANDLPADGIAGSATRNLLYQGNPIARTVSTSNSSSPPTLLSGSRVQVTTLGGNDLPVRESPSVEARQIDALANGDTVTVSGRTETDGLSYLQGVG